MTGTPVNNASLTNFTVEMETTTLINNLTALLTNFTNGNESVISSTFDHPTGNLQQPMLPGDDDDIHKNPELKYFSTVIIIFLGLTILILPVFCFVAFICAKARIFKTVRTAAGRGWGFGDLNVPYSEFGSAEDYTKADIATAPSSSSNSQNCDVKILVADDNRTPSSRNVGKGSFLRANDDEDEDISSLPPTFVHKSA